MGRNSPEIIKVRLVKGTPYVGKSLVRVAKHGREFEHYFMRKGKRVYFML